MNCAVSRRWLDTYLDGELDPTRRLDLEAHLATWLGQRVGPAHGAPNQLLVALHREFAKQDGKRIQIPLTHAARTAESEELQGSLTQQTLGHGSDHFQPTGPVLQTGDGCYHTVAQPVLVPPVRTS